MAATSCSSRVFAEAREAIGEPVRETIASLATFAGARSVVPPRAP